VRILLSQILASAEDIPTSSTSQGPRSVEDVSLICSLSQKRLSKPVVLDSLVVQRGISILRQPGGELYRPTADDAISIVTELDDDSPVLQMLRNFKGLPSSTSALLLRLERIALVPPSSSFTLESISRDFKGAINRANRTDLASHGPLELKSPTIVPPTIVLDEEV
jgi:hypothetical protein